MDDNMFIKIKANITKTETDTDTEVFFVGEEWSPIKNVASYILLIDSINKDVASIGYDTNIFNITLHKNKFVIEHEVNFKIKSVVNHYIRNWDFYNSELTEEYEFEHDPDEPTDEMFFGGLLGSNWREQLDWD